MSFLEAQRPKGPPPVTYHPLSLLRYGRRVQSDPVRRIEERFEQYGDVYSAPFLGRQVYVLRHPAHIEEVLLHQAHKFEKPSTGLVADQLRGLLGDGLLNSNGSFWRQQRRLIQPAFHPQRIASHAPLIVDHTLRMLRDLPEGGELDVGAAMTDLTLRIVSRALFDLDVRSEVQAFADAMLAVRGASTRLGALLPDWLATTSRRHALSALRELDAIVYGLIDRERESRDDLLGALKHEKNADGRPMSRRQLRDELLTLFVAGHETTAHALTFTWYLLSQHPDVESRVHAELDEVLDGRLPTLTDLPKLVYTEQVFCEALRLYPPAYVLARSLVADATVGPFRLERGADVFLRIFHTHRDPRWFPEPNRFDPDRFSPLRRKQLPNCAYLPFGAGSRTCIGKQFAIMEALLILASVSRSHVLACEVREPLALSMALTLAPKRPLRMVIRSR